MINSKNIFNVISSVGFMLVFLLPSYNINAQEEKEESNPLIFLTNINNLLQKSMTELNAGNYTGASDLVDTAYIDNYEYIEDSLKELDKDLMEETEIMIREDLAGAIEDKKSIDEITVLYNNIKTNLVMAEKLFKQ
ncbi:MAG TPA: hypothetical protein VIS28_01415 [Nitrososphaeraceae archaeon]